MPNPKVRSDDDGLFIVTNGQRYRPGSVAGHGHAFRMDDGGLKAGETVSAQAIGGTERARLRLADGTTTHWHAEGPARTRGLTAAPGGAVWREDGTRDFRRCTIG